MWFKEDELPAYVLDTLSKATVYTLFTPAHRMATSVFLEELLGEHS